VLDEPSFDVSSVIRRARVEGRRAGRSHGLGRPLADTLEQLSGRQWIKARFDEFIGESERWLVAQRRERNEELEVCRGRLREVADEIEREQARIGALAPERAADRSKPRHQQNLALEYELGSAHARLQKANARKHELALSVSRLEEQLAEIDREFTARPTRLKETRDSVEHEHDIAYRRAQHTSRMAILRRLLRARRGVARLERAQA